MKKLPNDCLEASYSLSTHSKDRNQPSRSVLGTNAEFIITKKSYGGKNSQFKNVSDKKHLDFKISKAKANRRLLSTLGHALAQVDDVVSKQRLPVEGRVAGLAAVELLP